MRKVQSIGQSSETMLSATELRHNTMTQHKGKLSMTMSKKHD